VVQMLGPEDLFAWYENVNLRTGARSLIDRIRSSKPSRRVGGGVSNVWGRYPSKKMGQTIQFESHRVELAGIYEMENAAGVLEYYDQPPQIMLSYRTPNGRHLGVWHTASFFVIRDDTAGWEEWKTEDELERLYQRNHNRYCRNGSGTWICPPGDSFAEEFGLYYRVRSSAEIKPTYLRNVVYLEDYLRWEPQVSEETRIAVFGLVRDLPGISVKDLIRMTASLATADDILGLIAVGDLYVDLHKDPLPDQARALVYSSQNQALSRERDTRLSVNFTSIQVGSSLVWSGKTWQVANVGESVVALLSSDRIINELPTQEFERMIKDGRISVLQLESSRSTASALLSLQAASPMALQKALKRASALSDFRHTGIIPPGVSERSLYRWQASERKAESLFSSGLVGLLPASSADRISLPKIPDSLRADMIEHISTDYETEKSKGMYASWLAFCTSCEAKGLKAPSYVTFCRACNDRPKYEQTKKRKGRRAAYALKPHYWLINRDTPRHGDRPFEIAHIDHTELDIELIEEDTGIVLGRAWLTIMFDAFSRSVLARYITFDPPSYRSVMMVIRDCVKRHNRLPQIIVLDGGPEFRSDYFEVLLAAYQCTKKTRPSAECRFGTVIERLFGTCNTQFIHNLRGNTKITKNVRQVTKSVNPKNLAVWTLRELQERLDEYLFEVYDNWEHPALSQSPRNCRHSGMQTHGSRLQKMIVYNDEFLFMTMPTTHKGKAKLVPGRGLKINYLLYWSEVFLDPEIEGRNLPVRYDPFDASIAYAYCRGQWVKCISEKATLFQGRSEREIQIATAEIRKKSKNTSNARFEINARTLAKFFASVEGQEALLMQRARDRAVNSAKRLVDGESADSDLAGGVIEKPNMQTLDLTREARTDYGDF
jgi:putative transposase